MLGWYAGSAAATASIAVSSPLPIGVRRPVTRLRSVPSSRSWSVVGDSTTCAKPEKATMPMAVPGPCRG